MMAKWVLAFFAAMALAAIPVWANDPVSNLPPSLQDLKDGGLVIFFRHAATDHQQSDDDHLDLNNCRTQRNLSSAGRAEAVEIGQAIQSLEIPIGDVYSSPFCRCVDTAQLAFGRAETKDFLYFAIGLSAEKRQNVTKKLKDLLSQKVGYGSNRVIVSHTGNLKEATGIWPKPEGVAWVFRPTGSSFEVLGKIAPDGWAELK